MNSPDRAIVDAPCESLPQLLADVQGLVLSTFEVLGLGARLWTGIPVAIDLDNPPRVRVMLERPTGVIELAHTFHGAAVSPSIVAAAERFFSEGLPRLSDALQAKAQAAQRVGSRRCVVVDLVNSHVSGCLVTGPKITRLFTAIVTDPTVGAAVAPEIRPAAGLVH